MAGKQAEHNLRAPRGHWRPLLYGGLLAALLAAGCGPGVGTGRAPAPAAAPAGPGAAPGAPAAASAPPAQLLKAKSAYTTVSATAAPWWLAQEAGYFREQGLDVELAHVDPGATLLAAMRNGELEVVFSGSPTLIVGYLQGLETMIIGTTSNKLDSVVFARPEVQSVQDLRGKTVGVNRLKAISDVAARLAFKRAGLEPDVDIFTRGTGGLAEAMAALETGAVDGASLSPPLVFEARKRGYRELLSVADLDIQFLNSAIGVTRKVLDERPELGERYLRALAQATSRLRTDRDFSIQVIGKYTQMDDRELLGMTVDYYRNQYALDPYPEPAALQTAIDAEEHPGARTLKPEEIIDFRAADALRRSGFLDTLPR